VRASKVADALDAVTHFPAGVLKLASCSIGLVREVWELRDGGYACLVLGDSLLHQSTVEGVEIQSIMKAMRAKGSAKYGRGASMGRGEGSKEVLGTMSI
jgi:hypothetical protein